jgi:ATP phosphoribosyltransferase regulatory subunit
MGDIALFDAFLETLGAPPPIAARLKRAVSDPWRLRRELADATGDGAQAVEGGRRLTHVLAGLSEGDAASVLEDIWALAGVEPVGGRSAGEIVHRLIGRAALNAAPRLSKDQSEMIARFLAIEDSPAVALAAVAELAGPRDGALTGAMQVWETRLHALASQGVPQDRLRLSTAFGRSFAYYDGVVFEVRSAELGDDQPVAAGGRYDSLAARLGHPLETGAVGCMVRPGRAWREAAQ